jgi:Carboxypeptidase regulatory-like domain
MKRMFLLLTLGILMPVAALAQTGSSSLRGTISDPQGSPVPGANVTLSNAERNFKRSQVTGSDGGYLFTGIPPGSYQFEVEMKGFKKSLLTNVQALVDTPTTLDVALAVGDVLGENTAGRVMQFALRWSF